MNGELAQMIALAAHGTAWLRDLRQRGAERLWLQIPTPVMQSVGGLAVPDHMLSGFAGAGRWFLVVTGAGSPETWSSLWSVGDRRAASRRIWDVAYVGTTSDQAIDPISPSPPA